MNIGRVKKADRLAAGHTLEQYERAYRQAFVDAAKKSNTNWKAGMPVKADVLDGITRESLKR